MPWPRKTSTCRSFVTISSGLCRLFAIVVLLHGQNHTSRWTRSMGVDHLWVGPEPGGGDDWQGDDRDPAQLQGPAAHPSGAEGAHALSQCRGPRRGCEVLWRMDARARV